MDPVLLHLGRLCTSIAQLPKHLLQMGADLLSPLVLIILGKAAYAFLVRRHDHHAFRGWDAGNYILSLQCLAPQSDLYNAIVSEVSEIRYAHLLVGFINELLSTT